MDVDVKFGDSTNYSTLVVAPVLRSFVQYLIAFCRRLKAAGDVISGRFVKQIFPR